MDGRTTWTDCDEAGDYVVPNVLSPRDQVSRPDKMDETVLHTILSLITFFTVLTFMKWAFMLFQVKTFYLVSYKINF